MCVRVCVCLGLLAPTSQGIAFGVLFQPNPSDDAKVRTCPLHSAKCACVYLIVVIYNTLVHEHVKEFRGRALKASLPYFLVRDSVLLTLYICNYSNSRLVGWLAS